MYRINIDILLTFEEVRRITNLADSPAQDTVVSCRVEFLIERKMLQVRPSNVIACLGKASLDKACTMKMQAML
jgi:hypothetical protein